MICPFCEHTLPDDNYIGITRCSDCSRAFSVHYAIGKDLLRTGNAEEALENFFKALKMFKNTALLHLDMARAYKILGNDEGFHFARGRAEEIDFDLYLEYARKYDLLD